jgi:hypothetical protein
MVFPPPGGSQAGAQGTQFVLGISKPDIEYEDEDDHKYCSPYRNRSRPRAEPPYT